MRTAILRQSRATGMWGPRPKRYRDTTRPAPAV